MVVIVMHMNNTSGGSKRIFIHIYIFLHQWGSHNHKRPIWLTITTRMFVASDAKNRGKTWCHQSPNILCEINN